MKKILYKSRAIQTGILLAAVILLISLWPLRLWHETVAISVEPEAGMVTSVITEDKTVLQSFIAQYDHLNSISLYLGEGTSGDLLWVRLFDEGQVLLAEEKVDLKDLKIPEYVKVLADVDMEVGKTYHCIVQGGENSRIYLGCRRSAEDRPYLLTMYYDNVPVEDIDLAADYNYGVPLRKEKTVLFGGLAVLLAAAFYCLVRTYFQKNPQKDGLITVERACRSVANPVIAVFTFVCLLAILLGACGNYLLDNTFFFVSVLLLAAILFYGVNHNRDGQEAIVTRDYLKEHIPDLLQSVFLAQAISGCCEYMAGLYDIHHAIAERKEMFWFALAVIAMFGWKEIFNLYNLIYVIAAGIYGHHYYQIEFRELLALETIRAEEIDMHKQVLKYTVWIGILLGLILIRTVVALCRRKLAKPCFLYSGLLTVLFAAMIIYRNGRWWTVVLAVAFVLFYLTYGMWEHKERFLVNLCRGIILQFMLATGYALLHRPFVTFRTVRYTHIFHTVTITATYLLIVECAATVILLAKLGKSRKLKDTWKELLLFGVVSSYMLFTMARTGFFAVAVMILFAVLLTAEGKGKKRLVRAGRAFGMMILAVLVCFPVTFTVQRTVPALVSDPYLFEFESYPDDIMRGRKLDSVEYMWVGHFIDVFADKIFGIPEGTFDIYGEHAAYRKTHDIYGNEVFAPSEHAVQEYEGIEMLFSKKQTVADSGIEIASVCYEPEDPGMSIEEMLEEGLIEEGEVRSGGREPEEQDYTNGRTDIFRSYIEQLNRTGHEEMGALLQDGSVAVHAHNIYLQVAYDHGIPVGILFVLTGLGSFIYGCLYFKRNKDKITYAAMPAVTVVAVAVAGMVEWIFHLCNPCGLVLMLAVAPLIFHEGQKQ